MNKKENNLIYFLDVSKDQSLLIKKFFKNAKIVNKLLTEKELIRKCKDAEIICSSNRQKISKKLIENSKKLKFIITRSVGYDHIDLETAKKYNILVANVPDYGSHVIAEFVFALLLSGLRQVDRADKLVENNYCFSINGLKGIALKNKTLGIIGAGKIGTNVARIASLGFNMNTLVYSPRKDLKKARLNKFKYVSLLEIFKKSDIISLHCPLFDETKHLINKKTLSKMKDGVIIVNTSRGALINTLDLTRAIKNKKVSHAFLDVIEHENNIKQHKKLIDLKPVIVTPHIAFYADDSINKQYSLACESINNFLNNKKVNGIIKGV